MITFLCSIVYITGIILLINKYIICFWCKSKVSLVGKTALITGGTTGIGYEIASGLAARGCRVIIADVVDTSKAVQEIIKTTHNPHVIGKHLDLASYKSVRDLVKDIYLTEDKLNILVNNAGIGCSNLQYTDDGLIKTMQVNHFSHFLLTYLLIDLLKKSAPSRIIFTSSIMAYYALTRVPYKFVPEKKISQKDLYAMYGTSKLYAAAISKKFAKKLQGTGITSNAYNPGGTKTQIFYKHFQTIWDFLPILIGFYVYIWGKTTEEAAQTPIYLAQADEVESVTGKFFTEGRSFFAPMQTANENFCDTLWEKSIIYSKLDDKEITI